MAINFMLSAANAIYHAGKTGKLLADRAVIQERIKICSKCKLMENSRCTACGCFIVIKAGLAAEACPKQKWAQTI